METMKLSDFVAETIKQISDGLNQAQQQLAKNGEEVNPCVSGEEKEMAKVGSFYHRSNRAVQTRVIEFDVLLSAAKDQGTAGSVGVSTVLIGGGVRGQSSEQSALANRIKFSIPVAFKHPPQK
jgi:hypothetical protein